MEQNIEKIADLELWKTLSMLAGAVILALKFAVIYLFKENNRLNNIIFNVQKDCSDHTSELTENFIKSNNEWKRILSELTD